mmetsp:Transcript_25765/g.48490  ORF Transcript_25765/g.48490 Transcript_25765/m.48490 type:complete len:298 (+) Transcript_25765:630-1523(+)
MSSLGTTQSSSSSCQTARPPFSTASKLRASSGGMKFPITSSFSFTWRVRSRMVSSMPSLSSWNSSVRSLISLLALWNLLHSFFSFLVLASTSSCKLPNFSSSSKFCSSWSAICRANASSLFFLSASSCSACLSSASCFAALLAISPPTMSFSSIALSLFCSESLWFSMSMRALLSFSSFSLNAWRSSSVWFCWSSSACMSCCALAFMSAFSLSIFSCISLIASSLTPPLMAEMSTSCPSSMTVPPSPPSMPMSWAFNLEISSWYSLSIASFGSSLILGLFLMFLALLAYLKVLIVSS